MKIAIGLQDQRTSLRRHAVGQRDRDPGPQGRHREAVVDRPSPPDPARRQPDLPVLETYSLLAYLAGPSTAQRLGTRETIHSLATEIIPRDTST